MCVFSDCVLGYCLGRVLWYFVCCLYGNWVVEFVMGVLGDVYVMVVGYVV